MIVVTGAAGMTCTSLLSRIADRYEFPAIRGIFYLRQPRIKGRNIDYFQADLRDPAQTRRALNDAQTVIISSVVTGGAAFLAKSFWSQVTDNLIMYSNLFRICHEQGVKRIIFVGTASIYQEIDGLIAEKHLDRNMPPNIRHSGIAAVMRFTEDIAAMLHQESGIDIIILRCANIYGPCDRFNPDFSNVVPALIRKAFERQHPFEVWGSPDVVRDLVYVDDIARLLERIIRAPCRGLTVINAGGGEAVTVGEMVGTVLAAAQYLNAEVCYCNDRPVTIRRRELDCSAATQIFGWRPEVSFSEGVAKTYNWWKDNHQRWDR